MLTVGSTVRVSSGWVFPKRIVGTLIAADFNAVTLKRERDDQIFVMPKSQVGRLDIFRGNRTPIEATLTGAKRGFLFGAGATVALALMGGALDLTSDCEECMITGFGAALFFGSQLTVVTTVGGALLGPEVARVRWKRVPAPWQLPRLDHRAASERTGR